MNEENNSEEEVEEKVARKAKTFDVGGETLTLKEIKLAILDEIKDLGLDEILVEKINLVCKVSVKSGGRKVASKTSLFRAELLEKGSMTEDEIWTTYKWGKHETLSTAWGFRKKGDPEDFIYVDFNRVDGVGIYSVVGTGPVEPEGYSTRNKKKD